MDPAEDGSHTRPGVTPLAAHLATLIRDEGPIGIDRYMALALGHPGHGYYATRDPFGARGDFTTAPEISQMFGEMIGLWCAETWHRMGRPEAFALVELGPGRGTLMVDALRAARIVPGFLEAASVHLVETSPVLRDRQRTALSSAPSPVRWHDSLAEVPDGPTLLVANEFLDALPIRQFVRGRAGWHERLVGLSPERTLLFGLSPAPVPYQNLASSPAALRGPRDLPSPLWGGPSRSEAEDRGGRPSLVPQRMDPHPARPLAESALPTRGREGRVESRNVGGAIPITGLDAAAREDAVFELAEAAAAVVRVAAGRLVACGGAALFIDYGHTESGLGDTLQAVRGHAFVDPLSDPGEADLTAHVDFASLARVAAKAGALVHGPVSQGDFLHALGIAARAERLAARAPPPATAGIAAALGRLTGEGEGRMGALFKAIGLSGPGLPDLPGLPAGVPTARRPEPAPASVT